MIGLLLAAVLVAVTATANIARDTSLSRIGRFGRFSVLSGSGLMIGFGILAIPFFGGMAGMSGGGAGLARLEPLLLIGVGALIAGIVALATDAGRQSRA